MAGIYALIGLIFLGVIARTLLKEGRRTGWYALPFAVVIGGGIDLVMGGYGISTAHPYTSWKDRSVLVGITVIVTDDLFSYKVVADNLQLGHQVCQFHVRRWVGKTLKELHNTVPQEWLWVLAEVQQLIDVLPPDGSKILYALWKQLPGRHFLPSQSRSALEQLRTLLLRLSQDWSRYCAFQSEPLLPWTNNPTEQAIGRMKMRTRTVRGYKSWSGMQSGLLLAGSSIV